MSDGKCVDCGSRDVHPCRYDKEQRLFCDGCCPGRGKRRTALSAPAPPGKISCPLCNITGPSKWFAFQGKEVICCAICQRDTVESELARERESRKQAEAELREAHGYLLASGFDGTMVMKRINAALAIPQEPAEPESGK